MPNATIRFFVLIVAVSILPAARAQLPSTPQLAQPLEFREFGLPFVGHNFAYRNTVALSSDNSLLAAGGASTIVVWDVKTQKVVSQMQYPRKQYAMHVVFSPDGKTLYSNGSDDPMIRFWDVKTGRQTGERPHGNAPKRQDDEDDAKPPGEGRYRNPFEFFSPDGKTMAVGRNYHELELVDIRSGKKLVDLGGYHQWRGNVGVSFDGGRIAIGGAGFRILNPADGKVVANLVKPIPPDRRGSGQFTYVQPTHGGKFVFGEYDVSNGDRPKWSIFGVDDGLEYYRFDNGGVRACLSPDGRLLIRSSSDGYLALLDTWSDKLFTDKETPRPVGWSLSPAHVSADGKFLVVIGAKANDQPEAVFLTPFPKLADPMIPETLSDADLEDLWTGFVGDNLFRQKFVEKVLRDRPQQAVDFLGAKIKPTSAEQRAALDSILKKLDDDDFVIRDKSTKALREWAHRFEPMLRDLAKNGPAGEARNRVRLVLGETATGSLPTETVGEIRGVAFLSRLPNPAANKVLQRLAAGAAGSRLTVEAVKALETPHE